MTLLYNCWDRTILPTSYRATIFRGGVAALTIGNGTSYPWLTMPTGLGSVTRQALIPIPGGGAIPAQPDVDEVSELGFEVILQGTTPLHVQQLRDALVTAWGARPDLDGFDTLALEMVSGVRIYQGRPLGPQVPLDPISTARYGTAKMAFVVMVPGFMGGGIGATVPTPHTVTLTLGGTSGGWGEPWGEPWGEGASGAGSDVTIAQLGNAFAPWSAVFNGPLEKPSLRLSTGMTSQLFSITETIPAGSALIVDTNTGLMALDGSPRSWAAYDAVWFDIPPAPATSNLSLRAVSGSGNVSLTYYDTYH